MPNAHMAQNSLGLS